MKNLLKSTAILICVLIAISLASCESIDKKVNEATASLQDKITSLKGEITELTSEVGDLEGQLDVLEAENQALKTDTEALETDKAALEAEKVALEAEKAALEKEKAKLENEMAEKEIELECAKGNHVIAEDSEYEYGWSADMLSCTACYLCKNCEKNVSATTTEITTNENGELVADFGNFAPSFVYKEPIFTGIYFNSDSSGYDETTDTFTISEDTPLIITFTGANLDFIGANNDFIVGAYCGNWMVLDYVYSTRYNLFTVEKTSVTVCLTYEFMVSYIEAYGNVEGFTMFNQYGSPAMAYQLILDVVTK